MNLLPLGKNMRSKAFNYLETFPRKSGSYHYWKFYIKLPFLSNWTKTVTERLTCFISSRLQCNNIFLLIFCRSFEWYESIKCSSFTQQFALFSYSSFYRHIRCTINWYTVNIILQIREDIRSALIRMCHLLLQNIIDVIIIHRDRLASNSSL